MLGPDCWLRCRACTCHCRYFPDNGADWDFNLDRVLEATFFPTLNYPDNNMLIFFLCSKCVVCCNCAMWVQCCTEGEKSGNKSDTTAKGTDSTVPQWGGRCIFTLNELSNRHEKGLHSFPQAPGQLLGSQQPQRNKSGAKPAARTTYGVAGAGLAFYCAFASRVLPSEMLIHNRVF